MWEKYDLEEEFETIDPSNSQKLENWYEFEWIMPLSWVAYWDNKIFLKHYPKTMKYLYSVYYSVLYIGLNEIAPTPGDTIQNISSYLLLLLSNYMNAFFLSEFVNISWKLLENGMDWQTRLDAVNKVIFYIELPYKQAEEIRRFLFQTNKLKEQ